MRIFNNKVECNDGTFSITNGAVAPCIGSGVKPPKSKFDFSGISELLNGGRSVNQPIDFVKYEQDQFKLEKAKYNAEKSISDAEKNNTKEIAKKNMTLTHIGLFVGGLALGYFAYKKFKN